MRGSETTIMEHHNITTLVTILAVVFVRQGFAQDSTPERKVAAAIKIFAEKNIHWLGHASFKLVGAKKTVFIDPFQLEKLEETDQADIICITHAHFDHCSPEDIAKLQSENTVIAAPSDCQDKIKGKVLAIHPGEKLEIDGVVIESLRAYNVNKKFHPKDKDWMGYVITLDGVRIYHAGDTDRIPEMKEVKADVALLPVSGTYVMTADEAAEAVLDFKPVVAIPMHYGTVVGTEEDAQRFAALLQGKVDVIIKKHE